VRVNSAGDALEFAAFPSIPDAETGATIVSKLSALVGNAQLPATAIRGLPTGITQAQSDKLAGIAAGAEVNVQSDWNATTGDAQILNKPTLVTSFRGLSDTPVAFGSAGQVPRVNSGRTALEFGNIPLPSLILRRSGAAEVLSTHARTIGFELIVGTFYLVEFVRRGFPKWEVLHIDSQGNNYISVFIQGDYYVINFYVPGVGQNGTAGIQSRSPGFNAINIKISLRDIYQLSSGTSS